MKATSTVQLRTHFLNGLIPSTSVVNNNDHNKDDQHLGLPTTDISTYQQHYAQTTSLGAPVVGRKIQRMLSTHSNTTFDMESKVDNTEDDTNDHVISSLNDSIESMQRRLDRIHLSINSSSVSYQTQNEKQQKSLTSNLNDANVVDYRHYHDQQHHPNDENDDKEDAEMSSYVEPQHSQQLQSDLHPFNHHEHHHDHHLNSRHQYHYEQNEPHYYKSALDDEMKPSESIVHYAATENQLVMMARLLEENSANLELTDTESNTPLIRAAIAGNEEMVKFLIEQNANVNAQNLFVSILLLFDDDDQLNFEI